VLQKLAHDDADLALISSAGAVPQGGLAVPLYRWKRVLLVPRAHPLAALERVPTLAELARHPLISYESSTRADSSLRRAFASVGAEPQIAMTARDANLIKTYVRAGLGAGLLAEMAIGHREDDDLRLLPANASPGRSSRAAACCANTPWRCCTRSRRRSTAATCARCWKATWKPTGRSRPPGPNCRSRSRCKAPHERDRIALTKPARNAVTSAKA
jgi:DNA-binding transcriptional LysR family regulator